MRIGIDGSRAFEKEATGTENYSWQILKNLTSIDTENIYYIYVRDSVKIKDNTFPDNVKIIPIRLPRLWTQVGLALKTFTDPLDVLFVPAHTIPIFRRPSLKTVTVVHDLGSEYLPSMHQLKQRLYLSFITNYQLRTATHLIAVSESTKQDLVRKVHLSPQKITVVYEACNEKIKSKEKIDQTLSKYKLKNRSYFFFIGTIQPRKNLVRLIEAFSIFLIELSNSDTECKLVIAGKPGWDFENILNLPKQLGIEKRVSFIGRVNDDELSQLYQGAIALTYPSLFEGFGLPILEAYANSCPVITSNSSSMPEVAGKGAILVDPYSVSDIMEAMKSLYLNEDLRTKLVRQGREKLKEFSWEKAAKETLDVLKKAVKEGK